MQPDQSAQSGQNRTGLPLSPRAPLHLLLEPSLAQVNRMLVGKGTWKMLSEGVFQAQSKTEAGREWRGYKGRWRMKSPALPYFLYN